MKKYNLKMMALGLLTMLAVYSCSVHHREQNRKPPRHDRNDNDRRDHNYNGY